MKQKSFEENVINFRTQVICMIKNSSINNFLFSNNLQIFFCYKTYGSLLFDNSNKDRASASLDFRELDDDARKGIAGRIRRVEGHRHNGHVRQQVDDLRQVRQCDGLHQLHGGRSDRARETLHFHASKAHGQGERVVAADRVISREDLQAVDKDAQLVVGGGYVLIEAGGGVDVVEALRRRIGRQLHVDVADLGVCGRAVDNCGRIGGET